MRVAPFESNPLMQWALETIRAAIPRGYETVSLLAYQDDVRVEATAHALDKDGEEVDCVALTLDDEASHAAFLLLSTQLVIHGVLISRYANREVGYEAHQVEIRLADEPWRAANVDISYAPGDRLGLDILISR